MIKFICKSCGQKFNVEDKHSGKKVKCPKCGNVEIVPDNSDKITFQCEHCGKEFSVSKSHAGKKGKCPKCQNIVIVPTREIIQPELAEPSTPIPPETDEDHYEEDTEEYEESEGINRRLIFIISGAAVVVVLVLIILAVTLRSSGRQPDVLTDQQQVVAQDLQPQPVTSDSEQNEISELLTDQGADVISTAQTSGYIDYIAELNKLGMAGRSESENAAPLYEKAFELYVTRSSQVMKLFSRDWSRDWPTDYSTDEQRLLRQWVESNSEALSQLELATQKPYIWFELSSRDPRDLVDRSYLEGTVFTVLIPNLSEFRNLSSALTMRAKFSAAESNIDNAIADIVTCYRFGLQINTGGPKSLVEQLVGLIIRSSATQTAFYMLDRTQLNKDSLEVLQNQIAQLSTDESYIFDFRSEKFSMLDIIQRIFTDDGNGDGQINLPVALPILRDAVNLSASGTGLNLSDEESLLQSLRRSQTIETVEKSYQHIDTLVRKSQWQLKSENADWMMVAKENFLVAAFFPEESIVQSIARIRAETEALITTLAVLRYEADKGQFPENLDELVASGYLQALPSDPFSDKTLTYQRTDEGGFTLYSFGRNLQDDGGKVGLNRSGQTLKWADNGDTVFWPVLR